MRLTLAAASLSLALTACPHTVDYRIETDPALGPEAPELARRAYADWQRCTPRIRYGGSTVLRIARKWPEDGYADVVGTTVRLPLGPWQRQPERRMGLLTHEIGHVFGLRHTVGSEPAVMSGTNVSHTVTAKDCTDFCALWRCRP